MNDRQFRQMTHNMRVAGVDGVFVGFVVGVVFATALCLWFWR